MARRVEIMKALLEEKCGPGPSPRRRGQDRALCHVSIHGHPDSRRAGVYYIQGSATGLIKIGLSRNVQRRLNGLQGSSPDRLRVLAIDWRVRDRGYVEGLLHDRFRDSRAHGEWFHPTPDLIAHIRSVQTLMAMGSGIEVHPNGMAD